MSDAELLEKVKLRMDLDGNTIHDSTLSEYINDVKEDLLDIGISEQLINSSASLGVITQGVRDLWNNISGDAKYSPYFYERADRLRRKVKSNG